MKGGFVTRLVPTWAHLILALMLWQTESSWGGWLMMEGLGGGLEKPARNPPTAAGSRIRRPLEKSFFNPAKQDFERRHVLSAPVP